MYNFKNVHIYNVLLDVIRILRLIFRYISFVVRRKFVRQSKQLVKVCQSLSLESLIRKSIFGSLMTWPRSFRLGWTFCSAVPQQEYTWICCLQNNTTFKNNKKTKLNQIKLMEST